MQLLKIFYAVSVLAILSLPTMLSAADHVISQQNKTFSVKELTIKVGDVVDFRNEDPFSHNVFSLSEVKSFDLGSYPQGQGRKVTFDKPGKVEVECSIHPNMRAIITVTP